MRNYMGTYPGSSSSSGSPPEKQPKSDQVSDIYSDGVKRRLVGSVDEYRVILPLVVMAYRLEPRRKLTARDIRLRCCYNRWSQCCKAYPWEGAGRPDVDVDDEEGSASGSGGSGDFTYTYTPECKKYNTKFVNNTYGDKCTNAYYLFRDVKTVRNIISLLYKCSVKKDQQFYKELMEVDREVRPGGDRCCLIHGREGVLPRVVQLLKAVGNDIQMLDKDFKLHNSLASIPCYIYGHSLTIEYKMTRAIWELGLYIHCAAESACT